MNEQAKIWVYVDSRYSTGDRDHLKLFTTTDASNEWFEENDPEGVAFQYDVIGPPMTEAVWRDNLQNAWAALRMIREAVETLGAPGGLISEEQVLAQYGPEPIDEATAIVNALTALLVQQGGSEAG